MQTPDCDSYPKQPSLGRRKKDAGHMNGRPTCYDPARSRSEQHGAGRLVVNRVQQHSRSAVNHDLGIIEVRDIDAFPSVVHGNATAIEAVVWHEAQIADEECCGSVGVGERHRAVAIDDVDVAAGIASHAAGAIDGRSVCAAIEVAGSQNHTRR